MDADPFIGSVLSDRYRVDALLGEGAMGKVYLAQHVLMRKRVALKLLHRELTAVPEIVQRFEREAMAAAHIDHPHVASATDFGKLPDGTVYLVLEYVEGKALTDLIERGPIAPMRAVAIVLQIASALEAAHARSIVHRDLKPDNILLIERDDDTDFAKVLDFGIAKVPSEPGADGKPFTQVGMVYGTPEYMAPEQALGQEVDGRADIYALGVILYEMLSGVRPYTGPVVGLLGQQLTTPLPAISDRAPGVRVPPGVEALVREMLETAAEKRVGSSSELVDRLRSMASALAHGPVNPSESRGSLLSSSFEEFSGRLQQASQVFGEPVQRAAKSPKSRGALLALVFGSVGVGAAILGIGAFTGGGTQEQPMVMEAAPAPAREEVALEEEIEVARKQGLAALRVLAGEHPAEGAIQAALAIELAKKTEYEEAVDAARVALALDPNLNESPAITGALYRAAQAKSASGSAFRLLEGAMGSAGADVVYDISRAEGVKPWVKSQADAFLASDELRGIASPALLVALELQSPKECPEMRSLVRRAALLGDKRSLPALEKLKSPVGCGPGSRTDCYPCLRSGKELSVAVETIQKRATLSGKPDRDLSQESL